MARQIVCIPAQKKYGGLSASTQHKLRVAAYCRVSTDQDDQLNSLENQIRYYTEYINSRPDWELVGIYPDEGISGTSTRKRESFQRMIADCEAGKIDLVITKSISRFARNTQDCLTYSRKLKDLGIGIKFEKENICTTDSTGELLFTILSSLAQDESRSISENCQWGIRSLFKQGVLHLNANRFYGYDKDENGRLVINKEQAKVVKWIFESFLDGISPDILARTLNEKGVPGCMGEPKWVVGTIEMILQNEKHMGDAILQKTFTADYLTKKMVKNNGELPQYHVEGDHEPIVSKEIWLAAQGELLRRKQFMEFHNLRTLGRNTDEQPFTSRVFCSDCLSVYWRRTLSRKGGPIKVWMCGNRYKDKNRGGGCPNTQIREDELHQAFVAAWNAVLENRAGFLPKWEEQAKSTSCLTAYRAKQFMKLTADGTPLDSIDFRLVSRVLEKVMVEREKKLDFFFLDGTAISIELED